MKLRFACAALALAGIAALVPAFAGPADDPANWRKIDPENLVQFTIKRQNVLIELRPDFAPAHVEQIKKIVRAEHYNNLPFHRVIDDFMAQGGEVSAIYMLYPPYPNINAEFTFQRKPAEKPVQWFGKAPSGEQLGYLDGYIVSGQPDQTAALMASQTVKTWALHCPGVTSMARADDPNSANTQFFLMRQANSQLDKTYTIWGRAVSGLDIIRDIKAGAAETDGRLAPSQADKLTRATMVADIPEARRPSVYVQRTDGPEFAAQLAAAANVDPYAVCNLPPVPAVVEMPQ